MSETVHTDAAAAPSAHVPKRFDRVARLLGGGAVERLAHRHVTVLGLGGVGSYAVEGLARTGVGWLTLVDFDDVCITNFNRQLHALEGTVGKPKVELMAERVRAIAPATRVEAIKAFYEESTSETLLTPVPDLVLDCIDNVTAKLHLLATCMRRRIPVITCLGAAAKVDPTRVRATPLAQTRMDPLAKAIRKTLRRRYGLTNADFAWVTAVFSDEPIILPQPDYRTALCGADCVCPNSRNPHHTCQRRRVVLGSAVFVTSVFGMVAASVAIQGLLREPPAEA